MLLEHHETLKEIWGEDLLNVVQQALAKAVQGLTRIVNISSISIIIRIEFKFC